MISFTIEEFSSWLDEYFKTLHKEREVLEAGSWIGKEGAIKNIHRRFDDIHACYSLIDRFLKEHQDERLF